MDEVVVRNGVVDAVYLNVDRPTHGGVLRPSNTVFAGWVARPDGSFSPPNQTPDPSSNFIPLPMLRQRIERLGMWEAFAGYIAQYPPLWLRILSLENGVDPASPEFVAAFEEMKVEHAYRDYILAPPSAGVGDPPPQG